MTWINHLKLGMAVMCLAVSLDSSGAEISYSEMLSLHDVMLATYERLPEKMTEETFSVLQQATTQRSETFFAEPISGNLSHFNDGIGSGDGFQEWEGSIDLPLWIAGQKQEHQRLAAAYGEQQPIYQQMLQLRASATVRELVWQVKFAELGVQQAQVALTSATQLEAEIAHRIEAGDLPKTEALRAKIHRLSAQSMYEQANAELTQAYVHYQHKTGQTDLPLSIVETSNERTVLSEVHPMLQWHDQEISLLQVKQGLAQFEGSTGPTLSVGVRRERGEVGESFNHSLGLGISVPFDDKRYHQPAIAAASAEVAEAQVLRQSVLNELDELLSHQQAELEQKQRSLGHLKMQERTTAEYVGLQKQAFDAGEIDLTQLINTQQLLTEIQAQRQTLEIDLQRQIALINQTLGISL
jgi:outer membrane protein TolC